MKVKELIFNLNKLDQELPIFFITELYDDFNKNEYVSEFKINSVKNVINDGEKKAYLFYKASK